MASSPASQVYIVRDDDDGVGLSLGGGLWNFDVEDWYFGTAKRLLWPGFASNVSSPRASFSYEFDGTEIRVFGTTADTNETQVFQVTIDNNAPYNTSTDDTSPEHYRQWYQSPPLSPGTHNIAFQLLDGQGLDYMVVAPGPQTSLTGTTLMVDDTYNGIKYSNGWQVDKSSTYVQSSIWGGSSFMNTSHETSTVGESLTFSYTGTNLSVYGNFLWEKVGGMTLSYSINGGTNFTQTFTSDGTNPIKEEPNFKLADTGPLSPGNYTVTLTLTDCVAQTLVVDYILYTPSFSNLASMPNLTASSTTQSSTSTVGQTSAASTGTNSPQPSSKSNAGAIAGGTVGGIVFLAILGALAFWWFRRRRLSNAEPQMSESHSPRPRPHHPNFIVQPFTGQVSDVQTPPPTVAKSGAGTTFQSSPDLSSYYQSSSPLSPAHDSSSVADSMAPTTGIPLAPNRFVQNPSHDSSSVADSMAPTTGIPPPKRFVQNPSGGDASSLAGSENIDDLRRQIHQLAEENRSLTAMNVPPAYSSQ